MAYAVMNERQIAEFESRMELNMSISASGMGRFRVNVFMQARGVSAVFRVIPHQMPTLDSLQVPAVIAESTGA